jgi:SPRY domain-containing SOCS box protein 3
LIGLLFDGVNGTLSYYKNGRALGVAFTGLHRIEEHIYPMLASTAARTEMTLGVRRRPAVNLQVSNDKAFIL